MSWIEYVQVGSTIIGTTAIVLSLLFVSFQVRLQRNEVERQRNVLAFEVYQKLSMRYSDLLWMACEKPHLNSIWEPLEAKRKAELDSAQSREEWGAWRIMDDPERESYRYTRLVLELLEQACEIRERRWIDDDTWNKWRAWMTIWKKTAYFVFVFPDSKPRFVPCFVRLLEEL